MSRTASILVCLILATILVFVVADLAGGMGGFPNEKWAAAIAMIALAAWIGPGALRRYSGNASGALSAFAIWLGLAVAVALLYVYGKDFLISIGVNVP